jgi:hypothetical protein
MENTTTPPMTIHVLPSEPALRGCRDRDLLIFIACQGVVAIDHVMSALVISRTAAYRRVAHCLEAGLAYVAVAEEAGVQLITDDAGILDLAPELATPPASAGRLYPRQRS